MKQIVSKKWAFAAAVIALAISGLNAEEAKPEKAKALEEGPMQIGGSSPVGGTDMVQTLNPKSPAMTKADFEVGKKIYFERCAGCCYDPPYSSLFVPSYSGVRQRESPTL